MKHSRRFHPWYFLFIGLFSTIPVFASCEDQFAETSIINSLQKLFQSGIDARALRDGNHVIVVMDFDAAIHSEAGTAFRNTFSASVIHTAAIELEPELRILRHRQRKFDSIKCGVAVPLALFPFEAIADLFALSFLKNVEVAVAVPALLTLLHTMAGDILGERLTSFKILEALFPGKAKFLQLRESALLHELRKMAMDSPGVVFSIVVAENPEQLSRRLQQRGLSVLGLTRPNPN